MSVSSPTGSMRADFQQSSFFPAPPPGPSSTRDASSDEELLTALRKGSFLLKHGRQGRPKVHFFRLVANDAELRWRSASGSVRAVPLGAVNSIISGQSTDSFRRHPLREPSASFSLCYSDGPSAARTLDLTCKDREQRDLWAGGLRVAVAKSAEAALAPAAAPPLDANAGAGAPGDLFMWGCADRRGSMRPDDAISSFSSSSGDPWPKSLTPVSVPGNTSLDAASVAVGRRHAAIVSAEGGLYVIGEGRGGKLGRGHDAPAATAQRLQHDLLPSVIATACGDDYTAAIAGDGQLFAWGRLPGAETAAVTIPTPVRGGLADVAVCQVSCGPFHAAAVAVDGRLFTWGEGFGGKLGHSDQLPRPHPAQVEALRSMPVLQVACGVWHTAAIALEPPGLPLSPAHHFNGCSGGGAAAGAPSSPLGAVPPIDESRAMLAAPADAPCSPPSAVNGLATTPSRGAGAAGGVFSFHQHRRTSSSLSGGGGGEGAYQEGRGGTLYTWGGINEAVAFGDGGSGGGGVGQRRDSNKGCLGHGEVDLYCGQLLPVRVGGGLDGKSVRHVAAGLHLTVAVTTAGGVYQMGATGASVGGKVVAPWEGAPSPEVVRGLLAGHFADAVACGMHHAVVVARAMDKKMGRPLDGGATAVFTWGRGSEGQLGTGRWEDAPSPVAVEGLRGRRVIAVACGGATTAVVCEHDVKKFEDVEGGKESADAATKAFLALLDQRKGEKAAVGASNSGDLHHHSGGGSSAFRAFSFSSGGSAKAAGPPNLGRFSSSSFQSSAGGSVHGASQFHRDSSASTAAAGGTAGTGGARPIVISLAGPSALTSSHRSFSSYRRAWSGRSLSAFPPASDLGSAGSLGLRSDVTADDNQLASGCAPGGHQQGGFPGMRRSASAAAERGGGGERGGAGVPSGAPSLGAISPASSSAALGAGGGGGAASVSSLQLHREGGHSYHSQSQQRSWQHDTNDDAHSVSSVASLQQELHEKGRHIVRLEHRLDQLLLQRRSAAAAVGAAAAEGVGGAEAGAKPAEERLRRRVAAEAEQYRESLRRASSDGGALSPLSGGGSGTAAGLLVQQQQRSGAAAATVQHPQQRGARTFRSGSASGSVPGGSVGVAPPLLADGGASQLESEMAEAATRAMETLLQRKQEELELQRSQLAAWEAALRGREAALAERQAALQGAGAPLESVPEAPMPEEWTEELEEGVVATFVGSGGLPGADPRLKRIRFSKTLFTTDSAAQWYEDNAHRLQALRDRSTSGSGRLHSGALLAAESSHEGSSGVGMAPSVSAAVGQQRPKVAHGRMTSTNLSFDARELAQLHASLHSEPPQQQQPSRKAMHHQVPAAAGLGEKERIDGNSWGDTRGASVSGSATPKFGSPEKHMIYLERGAETTTGAAETSPFAAEATLSSAAAAAAAELFPGAGDGANGAMGSPSELSMRSATSGEHGAGGGGDNNAEISSPLPAPPPSITPHSEVDLRSHVLQNSSPTPSPVHETVDAAAASEAAEQLEASGGVLRFMVGKLTRGFSRMSPTPSSPGLLHE